MDTLLDIFKEQSPEFIDGFMKRAEALGVDPYVLAAKLQQIPADQDKDAGIGDVWTGAKHIYKFTPISKLPGIAIDVAKQLPSRGFKNLDTVGGEVLRKRLPEQMKAYDQFNKDVGEGAYTGSGRGVALADRLNRLRVATTHSKDGKGWGNGPQQYKQQVAEQQQQLKAQHGMDKAQLKAVKSVGKSNKPKLPSYYERYQKNRAHWTPGLSNGGHTRAAPMTINMVQPTPAPKAPSYEEMLRDFNKKKNAV